MAQPDRTPAAGKDAFDCPRCGTFAHQEWSDLVREYEDQDGQPYYDDAWDTMAMEPIQRDPTVSALDQISAGLGRRPHSGYWQQSRCGRCDGFATWREDRLIFPVVSLAPQPHEDMPPEVTELYVEAGEVLGISRRAGAALARATLERLLKELDGDTAPGLDLKGRIDRMESNVSTSLWKLLTVIRHAGNKSVHVEDEPDEVTLLVLDPQEAEVVDLMFAAINDLVDELITKPARSEALYSKVPEAVRERVGQRKEKPATK